MMRIRLQDTTGTEVFDIPFSGFTIKEELNKGADGSISTSYNALDKYAKAFNTTVSDILTAKFREVIIYKGSTILFTGVLSRYQRNLNTNSITLYLKDYIAMLGTRFSAKSKIYTSEDSSDIAWDQINITQTKTNGDLGITRGVDPTTKDRDRTLVYDNVLKTIVGMSNAKVKNGYDFDIDTTKQFNIYYPTKGSLKENIIFDDRTRISGTINVSLAGSLANKVIVLGKGSEADMVTTERENTTPQSLWLLHEATLSEKGVGTEAELEDRGDEYLDKNDEPSDSVSLTISHIDGQPPVEEYSLGDSVVVRIEEDAVDGNYRVMKRTMKYADTHLLATIEVIK